MTKLKSSNRFTRQANWVLLLFLPVAAILSSLGTKSTLAQSDAPDHGPNPPAIIIDGTGPGWKELGEADFTRVNCDPETWVWEGSLVKSTGVPIGVLRSTKSYKNFEMVARWRHLSKGGNSGFFVWTPLDALDGLAPNRLPSAGIEVQVLDHGYTELYESSSGKKGDWFTTNGDIFPVGKSKLKPFPPLSPDGSRSFPRSNHSLGTPNWNHYYVRAINGEIRLWVNGHEVSGGNQADPSQGYLCLEAEGAPVEFQNIRIRELP
ncbi:3-keto-disaccharide hydrolase [Pirellulaceae bacterium SH449]